jgi:signal transduction histidine kinase
VEVAVERQGPLPKINVDPEQLKEVLVNLLVNACEAMEGGGRIIIVEEAQQVTETGSKWIRIHVKDNGPGIPTGIQEKILEPFFTTKDEGTGLGLSIAVRILEEHGGKLVLSTKEGVGTTVTVTLPLGETIHE